MSSETVPTVFPLVASARAGHVTNVAVERYLDREVAYRNVRAEGGWAVVNTDEAVFETPTLARSGLTAWN